MATSLQDLQQHHQDLNSSCNNSKMDHAEVLDYNHNSLNGSQNHVFLHQNSNNTSCPLLLKDNNSPWLSKPRLSEPTNSMPCTNSPQQQQQQRCDQCGTTTTTRSTKTGFMRNGTLQSPTTPTTPVIITNGGQHYQLFELGTLKLAIKYLGLDPPSNEWDNLCSLLKAREQDTVQFKDFIAAILEMYPNKMDSIGTLSEDILRVANDIKGQSCENKNNSVLLTVLTDRIIQLREENKTYKNELENMKHLVEESRLQSVRLEEELQIIRSELRDSIKVNRNLKNQLNTYMEKPPVLPPKKKNMIETGLQVNMATNNNAISDAEKRLSLVTKRHHRAEFNYHLHKIATEKLLKFAQVVHDKLIEYYSAKPLSEQAKPENNVNSATLKKPSKVNRASSMQSPNDASNYFINKYGSGGKVTRVASMCAGKLQNNAQQPLVHMKLVDCKHRDLLLVRIAQKAKELIEGITEILNDCEVRQNVVHFNKPDNKPLATKKKESDSNFMENNTRITTFPADNKNPTQAIVWV